METKMKFSNSWMEIWKVISSDSNGNTALYITLLSKVSLAYFQKLNISIPLILCTNLFLEAAESTAQLLLQEVFDILLSGLFLDKRLEFLQNHLTHWAKLIIILQTSIMHGLQVKAKSSIVSNHFLHFEKLMTWFCSRLGWVLQHTEAWPFTIVIFFVLSTINKSSIN